jgi:hypothetical protein
VKVSFAPLDRLSTWDEVRSAIAVASQGVFAFVGDSDDLREADADFSGGARNLLENDMWLAIVREMPYSKSN